MSESIAHLFPLAGWAPDTNEATNAIIKVSEQQNPSDFTPSGNFPGWQEMERNYWITERPSVTAELMEMLERRLYRLPVGPPELTRSIRCPGISLVTDNGERYSLGPIFDFKDLDSPQTDRRYWWKAARAAGCIPLPATQANLGPASPLDPTLFVAHA